MSGKVSRANRVVAVKAAKDTVYRLKAVPYSDDINPFDNDRQRRIFKKYYEQWVQQYEKFESMVAEFHAVFGG